MAFMQFSEVSTKDRQKNLINYLNDEEFLLSYIKESKSLATLSVILKKLDNNSIIIQTLNKHTKFLYNNTNIKNLDIIDNFYKAQCIRYDLTYEDVLCPCCKENFLPIGQIRKKIKQKNNKEYNKNKIIPLCCSFECQVKIRSNDDIKKKLSIIKSNAGKKRWSNVSDEYKSQFYEKVAKTNIEKYGTKCTLNTEENIKKKKETWIKHFGVDNPLKADVVKEKIRNTNIKKYGNPSPLNGTNKYKKIQTWKEKYGDDINWISEVDTVKKKMMNTKSIKYGTLQNFIDKMWINEVLSLDKIDPRKKQYKKYKIFTLPKTQKDIIVQGYEAEALEVYILKKYMETDIENSIKFMNNFNFRYIYEEDNIEHRYIPDFYIKSENLFIEVKSKYTLYKDLYRNFKKAESIIKQNYNYLILLISKPNKKTIKFKELTYEDFKIEVKKYFNIQ